MIWLLYNFLFSLIYLLMLPKFILRMCRRGGYRDGFMERFACYGDDKLRQLRENEGRIWIHAVSVGEVFVALRFMEEMRKVRPGSCFIFTVTTSTGHTIATEKKADDDVLLYFPLDFPLVMRRVLSILKPAALILTESEIWPNLIRLASKSEIPVAVINGRVSDSSYKGYSSLKFFARRVFGVVDLFLMQSESDAERVKDLGANAESVHAMGSSKYDGAILDRKAAEKAANVLEMCGITETSTLLVAGSTWPGEEDILANLFTKLSGEHDDFKMVIVPRHAERRAEVEADLSKYNISYIKRSELNSKLDKAVDVLLVDTTGELAGFYACASIVFVGKSLTNHGGQNFIEPAVCGKPVITGPNLENFPVVAADFISKDAIIKVQDAKDLEKHLRQLLSDSTLREEYGKRAVDVVNSKLGVVSKAAEKVKAIIDRQ